MIRDALKFGTFVLVCLGFLGWLAFTIGNIDLDDPLGRDDYTLTATFDDVTGLLIDDNVKVAGVVVGKVTDIETRSVILGHLQRGGVPTAYDRVLSTRFGLHAADAVHDKDFGKMVALHGTDIVRVPLAEAVGTLKTVPPERMSEAEVFFG